MAVFVDTSALLPILNQDDADFPQALRIWERLATEQAVLMTSNYVLVESMALIQNRLGMEAVRDLQESFVPLFQIVWVTEALHQMGVAALLAASRRQLSLVDCVSFAVCRQRQVEQVFAFDEHFSQQGFSCLTA
jgi:predicted nucleic acid-binding protein